MDLPMNTSSWPLSKDTVFAYDADDRSMTNVFSYEPTNTANDIPDGALYAGDYVEYNLSLGANLNSSLPSPWARASASSVGK